MAITWTEENAFQERINTWTHAFGFLLSIPAGGALVSLGLQKSSPMALACVIYAASLSAMYLFSTLSHAVQSPDLRHRIRSLDQGFIYALIAGTFTPLIVAFLEPGMCLGMLFFVWLSAAIGFYSKVFSKHRIDNMASLSYLLLGWIPAMVLMGFVPIYCFSWMLLGGVLYSVGVWFLQNDHRSLFHHAIWHIAVIVASGCHYVAIWVFAATTST
jgi:hemolysin III